MRRLFTTIQSATAQATSGDVVPISASGDAGSKSLNMMMKAELHAAVHVWRTRVSNSKNCTAHQG